MHTFLMNKFSVYHEADLGSNGGGSNDNPGEGGNDNPNDETNPEGGEDKGIMIPKSRFDEVNENYKSIKAELDALKGTQTQAEKDAQEQARKDAEAKGEFETLYNDTKAEVDTLTKDVETKDARIESLEGVINGLLTTKLENIDKEYHDLIPENMTAEQKLAWVNAAESKGIFGNKNAGQEPLGKKTNGKGSQDVDVNDLDPLQMLMSGYTSK